MTQKWEYKQLRTTFRKLVLLHKDENIDTSVNKKANLLKNELQIQLQEEIRNYTKKNLDISQTYRRYIQQMTRNHDKFFKLSLIACATMFSITLILSVLTFVYMVQAHHSYKSAEGMLINLSNSHEMVGILNIKELKKINASVKKLDVTIKRSR
ncbi:hypothetical protein HOG98_05560 [bacterium]|jgi:hypothetical protein|nr:hypothetical protein [bacterium]